MTYIDLDPDPVGVGEIADRIGRPRDTVDEWIRRHADFPAPRWTVSGRRAWAWPDVRWWLVATGRGDPNMLRSLVEDAVLRRLADAGGGPVTGTELANLPVPAGPAIPELGETPYGGDDAHGTAYYVPGATESVGDLGLLRSRISQLRRAGWIIETHDEGDELTYRLTGRSPLPVPDKPVGRPPADLDGGEADRVLACLMRAGTYGAPHSVVDEWAGRHLIGPDREAILDELRDRGYGIEIWQEGSTRWTRIIDLPA